MNGQLIGNISKALIYINEENDVIKIHVRENKKGIETADDIVDDKEENGIHNEW